MKHALACLCLTLLSGCSTAPAELSDQDVTGVKAVNDKFVKLALAGDWEAWGTTMTADSVTLPPSNAPLQGRAAAVAFGKALPKFTSFTVSIDEVAGRGDLAYMRGTYSLATLGADGSSINDKGSFIDVLRRQSDGTWLFARVIWHSDSPPPSPAALAGDSIVGTWVLNVAKSKYSPGPAPRSETRTYVAVGPDIKASSTGVDGEGKPTSGQWTVNYDGQDRPQTGTADSDALSLKRVDSMTTAFVQKRAGKVVQTGTRIISADGKTMTITTKGTNAKGQTISEVAVFDKKS